MNKCLVLTALIIELLISACSPIRSTIINKYTLDNYSTRLSKSTPKGSLLISLPEAVPGLRTEQMLYRDKPFEINAFSYNAWKNPPADMLQPLIIQAIQQSGIYKVITSTPNSESTHYRLDTQIIDLKQNFLEKPSKLELVIKVTLSDIDKNYPVRSKIMSYHLACPQDNPYGGVVAANAAVREFTLDLVKFLML